jgi:hypothetical protein
MSFGGVHQSFEPFAGILGSLTRELHTLNATISATNREVSHQTPSNVDSSLPLFKRRRVEHDATEGTYSGAYTACVTSSTSTLPLNFQDTASSDIIDSYFRRIHPWLSIIHEPSFRNRMQDEADKERLQTVVHSMTVASLRFVKHADKFLSVACVEEQTTRLRREVILATRNKTSIENVQALLIVIYVDIASDDVTSASSHLGVVWRHIESLELHVEDPTQTQSGGIFGKTRPTTTNAGWIEREEWRRIFWGAFMLDRLCAALLGHKPTCLSTATRRRLPVCSSFWYTNQPRPTPYLELSNTWNTGLEDRINLNHSILGQRPSDSPAIDSSGINSPMSGVGSLAFYVEAMESMSLILSHFLSLEINFSSRSDVSRWLTRFKELDLHLLWYVNQPCTGCIG